MNIRSIRTMKAAILAQSCAPLIVDRVELPDRLECGQVFVKILYSTICGSQLGEINAAKGQDKYLPHLLGHEASATVLECGPGVCHVAPEDLVVLHWRKGLGIESVPPRYSWKGKPLNAGWIATFSEYAIISENRMTVVDKAADPRLLPLLGCAVTTGMGVIVNDAALKLGQSVVVFGAGGVGLNEIQGAALAGGFPIIAIDLYDNRLDMAKQLGATHIINSTKQDAAAAIKKILTDCGQPEGADICIDNTGNTQIIEEAYGLCHSTGRVVCVGVPKAGNKANIFTLPLHFGKKIVGSHGGNAVPNVDIPRYMRLVHSGKLNLSELITEMYPLGAINTAIDRMRSGETSGRCCINCQE